MGSAISNPAGKPVAPCRAKIAAFSSAEHPDAMRFNA